jgi:thioester reductase-like protein
LTHVLLTGATGLVGRYLLRDLLLGGVPLAVLVRSQDGESAAQRVEAILTYWETNLGRKLPRPVCLEGDISREGLGLDADARAWVTGHCRSLLHNAASLTFIGKDRDREPWLSNLTGAQHVLDFCRQAGIRDLHHVSTAYVCGLRQGVILEDDVDLGQGFRNDYEKSKCEAEKLLRSATFLDQLTVYRPATIVGDSRTGYTSTYHGLYAYLQFAWVLVKYTERGPDGRHFIPVRLNATGDEPRNLVTVDWVSTVIAYLVQTPRHHGRTYHLAPLRPATARELEDAMSSYLGYYGPTFAGPGALTGGPMSALENQFYETVALYQPYWVSEPLFDSRNTLEAAGHLPCPPMDRALLHRLIDFGIADQWGKRNRRPPAKKSKKRQTSESP